MGVSYRDTLKDVGGGGDTVTRHYVSVAILQESRYYVEQSPFDKPTLMLSTFFKHIVMGMTVGWKRGNKENEERDVGAIYTVPHVD